MFVLKVEEIRERRKTEEPNPRPVGLIDSRKTEALGFE